MLGRRLNAVRAAAAAALAAAGSSVALAQPTTVRLEVIGGGEVAARVVAERIGGARPSSPDAGALEPPEVRPPEGEEAVVRSTVAPGKVDLALSGGLWRLHAEAAGFWSAPLRLWRGDGGAPSAPTLTLWPTGHLAGELSVRAGTPPPDELTLRFQATPPAAGPPPGELACPIVERRFRCEVPAAVLDLRLRARSLASHYRWAVTVPAGGALDLGRIELQPGASLVGWVETAGGAGFGERRPELVLRTRQPPPGGGEDPARRRLLRRVTGTTDRGFFHFEGLSPGRYRVYAKLDGYATAEAEVDLYERAESTLREPLILGPPRILEVEIEPPLDPTGRPWRLTLTRWSDRRSIGDVEATASPEGRWRQEGLPEGDYSLNVADAVGSRRLHHSFTVETESPHLVLVIPSVRVHGTVRLGGEPLAARIIFGGEFGAVSVPIVSDAEGDYTGTLPHAGRWAVTLEADEPPVRRELEVVVDEQEASGEAGAELDLELPDTRVSGQVVDGGGRPVERAFVTLRRPGHPELIRRPVASDGEFELRGVPPGSLEVHAEGVGGNSETIAIDLVEGRETPRLLLVLEPDLSARVEVVSASGPVPGAQVLAVPHTPNAVSPVVTTGVDGRARLRNLPGATRQITLAAFAPGFAARLFRTPVADRDVLAVEVDRLGGTLTVELDGVDPRAGGNVAFLSRDGARIGWQVLLNLAENRRTTTADGVRTVLPALEAGDYALCLAAAGDRLQTAVPIRCVEGRLDPLGHLELRLELPEPSG